MKTHTTTTTHRLRSSLVLALGLFATTYSAVQAAQPIVISGSESSNVVVNLQAPARDTEYTGPQRIIDGSDVITLVPPSLQKKEPAAKIVTPRVKPEITLPKTAEAKLKAEVAEVNPTPVPPISVTKLPPAETAKIETAIDEPGKFEAVPEKTALATAQPLPTLAEAETVKEEVASKAAAKVAAVGEENKPKESISSPVTAEVKDPQTAEKEIVVAALPPEKKPEPEPEPQPVIRETGDMTRILFSAGEAGLSETAEADIVAIADQLQNDGQNVQLIAYATGDSSSAARRMSLGRALSVRSKLMELGVKNNKIEVRALGQPTGDGPSDRVDLVMIAR